ncbi:signal peptidase I [Metabacillus sp. JX24]|uniref:signal peptidase I n=1 Tax=Metabacillus sp. JX24 TaxID=3240759 RepID=UPI00350FCF16
MTEHEKTSNTRKEIWSWIKSILFALAIAVICREFLFAPVVVEGKSMQPTFEDQNRLIISKTSGIERFDMIVFHSPEPGRDYIKRVIGLPGDQIEMKQDVLYINGKQFEEPYLAANKNMLGYGEQLTEDFQVTVPDNSYFVMGDNRRQSRDSREIGSIAKDEVIGEVKLRFFPFDKAGIPE